MTGGIPIGRPFGIALRLHYSWFIIFFVVTWALTASYYPTVYPQWAMPTRIAAGLVTSLLFFGSVLAHELMHSIVAQRQGLAVQSITLFVFGGVSQIAEEPKRPGDELRMAIAGPVTSLVLGAAFLGIWSWGQGQVGGWWEIVAAIAYWLGFINVILGAFNLIPGFPLDGGRVLRSILWSRSRNLRSATRTASNIGRGVGYVFIFLGLYRVFTGDWLNGLWLALIGWFLENAAVGSYRQLALQDILQGHVAREIMTQECPTVPPATTVEKLVNEHILGAGRRCFPVVDDGRFLGLVTLHNIKGVSRDRWGNTRVQETMTPLADLKWVKPTDELSKVLQVMTEGDVNQVPVVEDHNMVGIVTRDSILSFIDVRSGLGM